MTVFLVPLSAGQGGQETEGPEGGTLTLISLKKDGSLTQQTEGFKGILLK